ncbi:Hypothetical predicted protein, partial [Paramuricea clavata]
LKCVTCKDATSGADTCRICQKPCHTIDTCALSQSSKDQEEGFGSKVLCLRCAVAAEPKSQSCNLTLCQKFTQTVHAVRTNDCHHIEKDKGIPNNETEQVLKTKSSLSVLDFDMDVEKSFLTEPVTICEGPPHLEGNATEAMPEGKSGQQTSLATFFSGKSATHDKTTLDYIG